MILLPIYNISVAYEPQICIKAWIKILVVLFSIHFLMA